MSFSFKQFHINQSRCSQRVSTDACIFGAWVTEQMKDGLTCLDIGAGTGVLMLMLAQRWKGPVHGIEIDSECFSQLVENIQASPFKEKLTAVQGDVRDYRFGLSFELILSNPPFYEQQLLSPKGKKNIAWHSSMLSLAELFQVTTRALAPSGAFALLLPSTRKKEAIDIGLTHGLFLRKGTSVRHSSRHPVTREMMLFSKVEGPISQAILDIRLADGTYSERMIELLDDYYLNIRAGK